MQVQDRPGLDPRGPDDGGAVEAIRSAFDQDRRIEVAGDCEHGGKTR